MTINNYTAFNGGYLLESRDIFKRLCNYFCLCAYKATNGIKRHLAVDSLGLPFFTHCTRANVSDDQGLIEMLIHNINYFRQKPLELAKTTILQGPRLSHREDSNSAWTSVSRDHDQDSVRAISETLEGGKGSSREIRLCACGSALGDWAFQ